MSVNFKFPYNGQTVDVEDYYVKIDPFTQGTLWSSGQATYGQLGDNTTVNKSSPVQTIAFGQNWKQVCCSGLSKVALKTDGTLWSWGYNTQGTLGDNTTVNKSSPIQTVMGGTNWASINAGLYFAAGIKTDGTLWMWGYNSSGQLGDNTTVNKSSPVQTAAFGTNWKQVACGYRHTTAIKTDGTLWSWGINNQGSLGDNTTVSKSSPVQTTTFTSNWIQVCCAGQATTANNSTTAIKSDGTLWTWGGNVSGQLGDNTTVNKSSPIQTVTGGTNWKSCSMSCTQVAAIKNDGTLWGWGRNDLGELGDNTVANKSSPVQTVTGGNNWVKVSAGYCTTAIKADGSLWTWGYNGWGTLGDNTIVNKSSPIQTVMGGTNWKVSQSNSAIEPASAFIYRVDSFL